MPQPLKQLGTIKYYVQGVGDKYDKQYDKLYYDYDSKSYKLKKLKTKTIKASYFANNVSGRVQATLKTNSLNEEFVEILMGTYNNPILGIEPWNGNGINNIDSVICNCKNSLGVPTMSYRNASKSVQEYAMIGFNVVASNYWSIYVVVRKEKYGDRELSLSGVRDFFNTYEFEFEYLCDLNSFDALHKTVETKILEKPSLETYSPKTYISTNTEIQPSQMTITNKRNLINLRKMKSNTDYTLQLKCNKKGNKPIKINLCGKEKDIDATIGVNHINVTTNELNGNNLELSGEGNVVSEIIVIEGEMNQYPSYFDGIQNTGELQDDGTYKIDVSTNNGGFKNLFDINNFFVNSNNRGSYVVSSEDNSITSNYTDWYYTVETNIDLKTGKEYLIKLDFEAMTVSTSTYSLIMLGDKGYNLNSYIHADFEKIIQYAPSTEDKLKTSFNIIYTPSSDKTVYFGLSSGLRNSGSIKIKNIEIAEYSDNLNMSIPLKSHKVSVQTNSPLAKGDKLYWNKSNKRYEIDRGGNIEVPTVSGDVIDLPRLYQRENTYFSTSTGNIKPSKIKLDYNDLD